MPAKRTVMFHAFDESADLDALMSEAQRVLDEHARVLRATIRPRARRVDLVVEFAHEIEIEPLTHSAHNALLHLSSVEMEVAR